MVLRHSSAIGSVRKIAALIALLVLFAICANGQSPFVSFQQITTLAGNGVQGYAGDGGPATQAEFGPYLSGTVTDSAFNSYICDAGNARIRKVDASGIITTFAGNGTSGYSGDGGIATSATLNGPDGIVVDSSGNVYFTEFNNKTLRMVDTNGVISTFASFTGQPTDVAIDANGNFYVALYAENRIVKITPQGVQSTFAGSFNAGYSGDGGAATSARLNNPNSVSVDAAGNVYIADVNNNVIRKVDTSGTITTFAGNGSAGYSGDGGPATLAQLNAPSHPALDEFGNVYIPDSTNNVIRVVQTDGTISTFAGTGTAGYFGDGGPGLAAKLNVPVQMNFTNGTFGFTDSYNEVIRQFLRQNNMTLDTSTGQAKFPVVIQNISNFPLQFTNFAGFRGFTVVPGGSCNFTGTLQRGQLCSIVVQFTPTATGIIQGEVDVLNNVSANADALSLTANATQTLSTSVVVQAPASIVYGQPLTVTAVVSSPSGVPDGEVLFRGGQNILYQTATLDSSGTASITIPNLAAGTYHFDAIYLASATYLSSLSQGIPVTVTGVPTATTLSASSASVTAGQSVTFTAAVTGGSGTLSGAVAFTDGTTALGTGQLNSSGDASFTTTALGVGTHNVVATYAGAGNSAGSSSTAVQVTVNPIVSPAPSISNISPTHTNAGASSFTVTISGENFTSGATATFNGSARATTFSSSTQLKIALTSADLASTGIGAIAVQDVTGGTVSNSLSFAVDSKASAATGFTASLPATPVVVNAGQSATYPVGLNFFGAAAVKLSAKCLNLPTSATCSYNSSTQTLTITTDPSTPRGQYVVTVVFTVATTASLWLPTALASILPFGFFADGRLRRRRLLALLAIAALATVTLVACGGGSSQTTSTTTTTTISPDSQSSGDALLTVQ